MVIFDNSFLGGGKLGLIQESYLPSLGTLENNHFSVQSHFFEGVGFQLSQLQTKTLMSVNVNFYNNEYNILQLKGARPQSISYRATTCPAIQRWAELDTSFSCCSPSCGALRSVVKFSPISKPQVKFPQRLELWDPGFLFQACPHEQFINIMFPYNFYIITVINKFECNWGMHAGGLHKN